MARNTWSERDFPILEYLVDRFEAGADEVETHEIARAVGVPATDVEVSLKALRQAGYVTALGAELGGLSWAEGVSERARREVGAWPSADGILDRLVTRLEEVERNEPDPERRDKVVAVRQALTGFLRDVAVGVVSSSLGVPH